MKVRVKDDEDGTMDLELINIKLFQKLPTINVYNYIIKIII